MSDCSCVREMDLIIEDAMAGRTVLYKGPRKRDCRSLDETDLFLEAESGMKKVSKPSPSCGRGDRFLAICEPLGLGR